VKALLRRLFRHPEPPQPGDFEIFLGGGWFGRNVLVFTEYVNATYFISFDIPFRRMNSRGKVNLGVVSQKNARARGAGFWKRLADTFRPDVVIMTRYGLPFGPEILAFFKNRKIPVIYHIDDDLLEVPESLGAEIRKRQGADAVVEARRHLLAHCDLIYASTPYLAELLQERFPAQRIFHGIYAPYMGEALQQVHRAARGYPVIGYMGSKGHQHDLELVVPALERLLDERPNLHFEVFGTIQMPAALERFGDRVQSHSVQQSYVEFLRTLGLLGWDIGLAPLVDAPFNRCKAPTKFIEYTACGVPVIASEIPVYSQIMPPGGGILVKDGWHESISHFLDDPERRKRALALAQSHCASTFSVHHLEKQLTHVFNKRSTR
jgi:glycosyltransferase involved in cell wall biosynthesis